MTIPRVRCCWLLFPVLAAGTAVLVRAGPDEDLEERIAGLIQQLGDAKFANREAADKEIEAIGELALPAVRCAMIANPDLEIRRRAQKLDRKIMPATSRSKVNGMLLSRVDAGEFLMGSPEGEKGRRDDEAAHRVRITTPIYMGAHEVTQGDFDRVMKFNPSWFSSQSTGAGKDKVARLETRSFPVENVSWFDAIEFCNRLSYLDKLPPYFLLADVEREANSIKKATVTVLGGRGYRLPTEAEWERACRGWTTTRFSFGDENSGREANSKAIEPTGYASPPKRQDLDRSTKVGSYPANRMGLHDMHGNVAEWCWDWYDKDYYADSPAADPAGPESGKHRVIRGGSWFSGDASCRSASRFWQTPDECKNYVGFRVCRTP